MQMGGWMLGVGEGKGVERRCLQWHGLIWAWGDEMGTGESKD